MKLYQAEREENVPPMPNVYFTSVFDSFCWLGYQLATQWEKMGTLTHFAVVTNKQNKNNKIERRFLNWTKFIVPFLHLIIHHKYPYIYELRFGMYAGIIKQIGPFQWLNNIKKDGNYTITKWIRNPGPSATLNLLLKKPHNIRCKSN